MDRQTDFCTRIAAQCGQRADESGDEQVRAFLNRMRDNWLSVAKGLQGTKSTGTPQPVPDAPPGSIGGPHWRGRAARHGLGH